jgi:hypothetical protein
MRMNAMIETSVTSPIIDTTIGIPNSTIGKTLTRSTGAIMEIGFIIHSTKESAIKRTNIPAPYGNSEVIPTINMTFA